MVHWGTHWRCSEHHNQFPPSRTSPSETVNRLLLIGFYQSGTGPLVDILNNGLFILSMPWIWVIEDPKLPPIVVIIIDEMHSTLRVDYTPDNSAVCNISITSHIVLQYKIMMYRSWSDPLLRHCDVRWIPFDNDVVSSSECKACNEWTSPYTYVLKTWEWYAIPSNRKRQTHALTLLRVAFAARQTIPALSCIIPYFRLACRNTKSAFWRFLPYIITVYSHNTADKIGLI